MQSFLSFIAGSIKNIVKKIFCPRYRYRNNAGNHQRDGERSASRGRRRGEAPEKEDSGPREQKSASAIETEGENSPQSRTVQVPVEKQASSSPPSRIRIVPPIPEIQVIPEIVITPPENTILLEEN